MNEDMLDRYHRAAAMAPDRLRALIRNRTVEARWTGAGDTFWYRRERDGHGHEFVLVDPDDPGRRRPLFDHGELAAMLGKALDTTVDPYQLPVSGYERDAAGAVRVVLADGRTVLSVPGGEPVVNEPRTGVLTGPGGKHELFCRDHDLWVRDTATGAERCLTTGGEPHYAWGALPDNSLVHIPMERAGTTLPPVFTAFSPSGRTVVTARVDERRAAAWPFVEHLPADGARPRLHPIRGTLDEEDWTGTPQLAFAGLDSGKVVVIDVERELLGSLLMTGADALSWEPGEECVYLFAHAPGQRVAALWRIDVATGDRRIVVSETDDPVYEPNTFLYSLPLIRVLPRSGEVIWFSQRNGWGHLYRYDLATGACQNAITTGDLVVRDLIRVDEDRREVLFLAGCGGDGDNPYWRKLYRAALDGGQQTLLTPEPADHQIPAPAPQFFTVVFGAGPATPVSPSGRYLLDHMSAVDQPPQIVLRDTRTGRVLSTLERTDVTGLLAAGYQPPEQFHVRTGDGQADIWGVITLPADLTAGRRVPIIDLMYAGFQEIWQPVSYFGTDRLGAGAWAPHAASAFAALGFATVVLDGRGTPGRDKVFRQWTQGHPGTPRGLEDHVAAISALAERYPLDLERVGVIGHSYGGYNSVRATLLFPDFFKVCVSSAGVHVPEKMPKGSWNWHVGPGTPRDSAQYQALGNLHLADRLAGRLLLLFGDLDENATPDHSLALADALIRAGKRFDMKLWPGLDHYRTGTAYATRTIWDYFVEHLLGCMPPAQYSAAEPVTLDRSSA
jgi:dipeptidyl-peptidase-4